MFQHDLVFALAALHVRCTAIVRLTVASAITALPYGFVKAVEQTTTVLLHRAIHIGIYEGLPVVVLVVALLAALLLQCPCS